VTEGVSAAADPLGGRPAAAGAPPSPRVLVTVPWATLAGGAEAMLQSILDGADEGPFEFHIVFFEDGPWPHDLREAGFDVTVLPVGRLRQPHRFARAVRRLAAQMRELQPEVILNWSAKTQLYGAPAAVLAGLGGRVIWWQQAIPLGSMVDRAATLLPARAIFCYSGPAARAQRRLRPGRTTVPIAAGSPPPASGEAPAAIELPGDVPIVGLVGRLQAWKGQDRLLRAQALLRDRGLQMHCLIVGGDAFGLEPGYAASVPRLVEELGLGEHVTMTGQVPDAGPFIERMDVLVNASDPEPFGIVLLEGMARGVAVLAVDAGGPSEIIRDGRTGALARSGEPEALADALEPLLRSPAERVRLAQAGHESFMQEFTDAAMRARVFAALRLQLGAPSAAPAG
jgi:glycosyltransferase involved in cell wall biosynthesis